MDSRRLGHPWPGNSWGGLGITPQVSVVIDNYNYARFLDDSISSALNQTYPNTEVVVVDDGSTDESVEIVRSHVPSVTAVIKQNGGQGSAFNAGFSASRGDIVLFLDSDDILLPNAVEQTVSIFEPSVSRVYWPMWIIDSDGRRIGGTTNAELPEGDLSRKVLTGGPYRYRWSPTSGNAWDRAFLEAVLPVPEETFMNYVDNYLSALSPLYGRHKRADPLGCWRSHGASETKTALDREGFMQRLDAWLERFDTCLSATGDHASALGFDFDAGQWRLNSWFHRIDSAVRQLLSRVPRSSGFALLDEGKWQVGGEIEGREVRPFPDRDGVYWGRPSDDASAIAALDGLRRIGTEWLAVAWPSFWWLDHYVGMSDWLRSNAERVHSDRNVVLFEIRPL